VCDPQLRDAQRLTSRPVPINLAPPTAILPSWRAYNPDGPGGEPRPRPRGDAEEAHRGERGRVAPA
jgi:hypothetical protein